MQEFFDKVAKKFIELSANHEKLELWVKGSLEYFNLEMFNVRNIADDIHALEVKQPN